MNASLYMDRIALGTVQFGLPYGVANAGGQVSADEVSRILHSARIAGVTTLDTAIAYGSSEAVLGQNDLSGFSVTTKLPEIPEGCFDLPQWVHARIHESCTRLGVRTLDGVLLHRPAQLLDERGQVLYKALTSLKEQGLAQRIGVSVYGPEELDALCPQYHFDLVQAPFNVLDRRMQTSGWLTRLKQSGTDVHVRSVFLQGLLLMNRHQRPAKFSPWTYLWDTWQQWLEEENLTPLQACLRFVLGTAHIEKIVVGVDNLAHWQQIQQAATSHLTVLPDTLSCEDPLLLNPGHWNKL
ncbi:aldo/keto reductase [Zobellella iuensis]|uniref:Aldo/keto reductase n=1 Tax=Zobellella iuensis TaxID=2803811 RepID=A0ABS1QUF2_9GAMM|nr:aldo/keto reductase [Zobellella iuensis]MBL1378396.1 aldo/keto reductase [Zobellella iuensis]